MNVEVLVNCAHDKMQDMDLLVPNPKNPNKHPEKQIKLLAKIMKHQGWRSPIVVSNRSGFIIKGHGRLEAAKLNGWTQAPIDFQDYANDADEYSDMVADNKIAELANTDLSHVLKDVLDLGPDFDLDLLGIPDFKLPEEFEPQADEDDLPDVGVPIAKPGDVYKLGRHRLMCGDSTNIQHVELLMDGEKADLVFTDPTYGVSYEQGKFTGKQSKKKFEPIANDEKRGAELYDFLLQVWACIHVVTDVCVIYCWSPPLLPGAEILKSLVDSGFHIQSQLIWNKKRLVLGRADYQWQHEICWYGYKGQHHFWCGDRDQTSVWEQKRDGTYNHPTQKPVELSKRAIINSCPANGIVLDLFGGSGSTMIGAEAEGRSARLMELSPNYVDVIVARWEKYTGKKAELING